MYKTNDDHVTVIGAGVTLHEALAAAEQLKKGTEKERQTARNQVMSAEETEQYTLLYGYDKVQSFI